MRNKHIVKMVMPCKCPKQSCGVEFDKSITMEFVSNQRGDIIEYKVLSQ